MPLLDQVRRERLREGVDRALGRRVVEQVLAAEQAGDRAGVDDRAALLQVRHGRLRHVEVAVEVRLDRAVEVLVGELLESCACSWKAALLTRMSSLPSSRTVRSTASSQKSESVTSPGMSRQRRPSRSTASRVSSASTSSAEIHDRDVGALARVEHGDRAADPGIAAGDERDLVLQLARALVLRRHVARAQLELRLEPRLLQMLLRQRRLGLLSHTGLRGAILLLAFLLLLLLLLLVRAVDLTLDAAVLLARILARGATARARRGGCRRRTLLSLGGIARRIAPLASLGSSHLSAAGRVRYQARSPRPGVGRVVSSKIAPPTPHSRLSRRAVRPFNDGMRIPNAMRPNGPDQSRTASDG